MTIKSNKYIILFIISLLSVIIVPFFLSYGGITPDSISYFKLAKDFPSIKDNLFPLGYPILLKLGYLFTGEFYFSSRIISILSYILIGVFSYYRNFYFKETVILLTFKFFLSLYINSISESIFLTLLYFQIYYLHEYFSGNKRGVQFILPAALITIYMVMVRYTGVYVFIVIGLYFFYLSIKNKELLSLTFLSKNYFYYLLFSFTGISIYLGYNYINFGSFFGEHIRKAPYIEELNSFIFENLVGAINVVNPLFSIKIVNLEGVSFFLEIIFILIDILFCIVFIQLYKRYFKNNITEFHSLLLIIGVTYFAFIIFSEFNQGIEPLNTRMLAGASMPLAFSFLILFYKVFPSKEKYIFALGILSLLFNTVYQLKKPVNYLVYKKKVDKIMIDKQDIKYFYDDTKEIKKISIYNIPIINKKIEYIHPYLQSGYINANIVRMKNPDILVIDTDSTIKNKNVILYNSKIK